MAFRFRLGPNRTTDTFIQVSQECVSDILLDDFVLRHAGYAAPAFQLRLRQLLRRKGERPRPFIKMAFYLDAVSRNTGSLRVMPGSHCWGDHFADRLHNALQAHVPGYPKESHAKDLGVVPSELPSNALTSNPGDVVVSLVLRNANLA